MLTAQKQPFANVSCRQSFLFYSIWFIAGNKCDETQDTVNPDEVKPKDGPRKFHIILWIDLCRKITFLELVYCALFVKRCVKGV